MLNIYVVGCGGIGCYIIERLSMVLGSLTLDLLQPGDREAAYPTLGSEPLHCLVDRIVLIDGDRFNPRNAVRQRAGAGDKVVQRVRMLKNQMVLYQKAVYGVRDVKQDMQDLKEILARPSLDGLDRNIGILQDEQQLTGELLDSLKDDMIRAVALQPTEIIGVRRYLNPDNIRAIIPLNPPAGKHDDYWMPVEASRKDTGLPSLNTTVIFLGVDNKKTRYEVQKYAEKFDNVLLINGGNDKTTGQVNVYERQNGVAFDPTLYDLYPDISPDADRRPDEVECGAVAPKHDQIAITNSMIANLMFSWFVKWARSGLFVTEKGKRKRYNEVLLDIEKPSVMPLCHPL